MALVAKMLCGSATRSAGSLWVPCEATDEGACSTSVIENPGGDLTFVIHTPTGDIRYSGVPQWLPPDGFVRNVLGTAQVQVKLNAVTDQENNSMWAMATPAGSLELTLNNPSAFDYLEPGVEYVVEIRRAMPQKARQRAAS